MAKKPLTIWAGEDLRIELTERAAIRGKSVSDFAREVLRIGLDSLDGKRSGTDPEMVRFLSEKVAGTYALLRSLSPKIDPDGHQKRMQLVEAIADQETSERR